MHQQASVRTETIRRAARGEKLLLLLDHNRKACFISAEPDSRGEEVLVENGDTLSLNDIPDDLDCRFQLDGLETVRVDEKNFRFSNHEDLRCSVKCFAGRGIKITLIDHAGAGYKLVGPDGAKHLEYVDPVEEEDFNLIAVGSGC